MTYTDFDCGIQQPHKHTGEIVEGYFIEYWCPTMCAWTSDNTSYGARCQCTTDHTKARIQHTMTEIIEIVIPIEQYIREELERMFYNRLLMGDNNETG